MPLSGRPTAGGTGVFNRLGGSQPLERYAAAGKGIQSMVVACGATDSHAQRFGLLRSYLRHLSRRPAMSNFREGVAELFGGRAGHAKAWGRHRAEMAQKESKSSAGKGTRAQGASPHLAIEDMPASCPAMRAVPATPVVLDSDCEPLRLAGDDACSAPPSVVSVGDESTISGAIDGAVPPVSCGAGSSAAQGLVLSPSEETTEFASSGVGLLDATTCARRGQAVNPLKATMKTKTSWICWGCGRKGTKLIRMFGSWPPSEFRRLSAAEQQNFWAAPMETDVDLQQRVEDMLKKL